MNQLSRTERFFIETVGWTVTVLALPFGAAIGGLFIDGAMLPR